MCVYSMVVDHYNDRFSPWIRPQTVQPFEPYEALPPPITPVDAEKLKKLIADFYGAIEAAKTVDKLTAQPNCEDPEKAKLVERVAALEKELAALKKKPRRPLTPRAKGKRS